VFEIGLVEAVINQSFISIEREFGVSESLWCGTAMAADIMNWEVAVVDDEEIELYLWR
jgi:hypothetical protein